MNEEPARLFAYGTLMLPEVMEVVAGRRCTARPAVLPGHRRRLLRGAVYPVLVPAAGESVAGVLWEALDEAALARIDRFEDAIYERIRRRVVLARDEEREAFVYVLRPEHAALAADDAWDEADFRVRHLGAFLAACREFARTLGRATLRDPRGPR
jgi:gamma-glutamylcyclotransferase (GGCT)/AIG2-like uncharacterized protein YtfP